MAEIVLNPFAREDPAGLIYRQKQLIKRYERALELILVAKTLEDAKTYADEALGEQVTA